MPPCTRYRSKNNSVMSALRLLFASLPPTGVPALRSVLGDVVESSTATAGMRSTTSFVRPIALTRKHSVVDTASLKGSLASVSPTALVAAQAPAAEQAAASVAVHDPEAEMAAAAARAAAIENEACALVEDANKALDGGLHRCKSWELVKDAYFHAGALFASIGRQDAASISFHHAAGICRVMGTDFEVASALGFAIENYRICDPLTAIQLLQESIEIYARNKMEMQVARCYKEMGEVHESLGNAKEALVEYQQAVDHYRDRSTLQLKKHCDEKVRALLIKLGEFKLASEKYERAAMTITKGLSPTFFYAMSTLCYIAEAEGERFGSGIAKAKKKFSEFQDNDQQLQKGVEFRFIRDVFLAFDKPSLGMLDDAFVRFRSARSEIDSAILDPLLAKVRNNLFYYLLPYM